MGLVVATEPAAEPVIWEPEVKDHLRVDVDTEQAHVEALIVAARTHVENWIGRTLIDTTYDFTINELPNEIDLPRSNVSSIVSLKITDESDVQTTIAASEYRLGTVDEIQRVVKTRIGDYGTTVLRNSDAVVVRFIAGYGTAGCDIPAPIIAAIKILIAHWFENRERVVIGTSAGDIPLSVEALLGPYRVWRTL